MIQKKQKSTSLTSRGCWALVPKERNKALGTYELNEYVLLACKYIRL